MKKTKRCKSIDRIIGERCTLARDHEGPHSNGMLVWPDQPPVFQPIWWTESPAATEAEMTPAEQALRDWWHEAAADEIHRTVPKAVEYSSTDLADIGHVLARTAGRQVTDEEAAELGVFFYLQGKLSRWAGAVAQGKRPSDDTIFDIGVYCRMAQRIRHSGGWPGTETEYSVKQQTYGMERQ